jgi:hypothetical protein
LIKADALNSFECDGPSPIVLKLLTVKYGLKSPNAL